MRADVDIADTLCHLSTVVASAGHLQLSMYAWIQSGRFSARGGSTGFKPLLAQIGFLAITRLIDRSIRSLLIEIVRFKDATNQSGEFLICADRKYNYSTVGSGL